MSETSAREAGGDAAATAFGALLRGHRRAAGLTQEALAERAGLSRRGLQHLEAGDVGPHPATLAALAAALDLVPAERARLRAAVPTGRAGAGPPAAPSGPPPVREGSGSPPLPLELTSFVGRERELAAVGARLRAAEVRLLTLTGPGGVGKTRLALRAAADALGGYPGGAWFVPLAPLGDPALVAAAVAGVLGVREAGHAGPAAAVAAFLRGRRLLLVLDNCEHLLPAAPLVAGLLAACPGLTVLATSRAPLRLAGEHQLAVPPLALPAPGRPPPADGLLGYEAPALFVQRAVAAQADFAVTGETAPAVVELCHRLDGLPLALELAAARVRLLPPRALLARLDRRLAVLTGGPRDAPARQQTLRATLDWSHALLAPAEQALFRRLAVFAGGFTLAAAEAVCGAGGGPDVLAGLAALVDGSLVTPEAQPGGAPRFRLLETVREYALERLEAAGEGEALRALHGAHFLALAEGAAPYLHSPDERPPPDPAASGPAATKAWLDRLEAEHPNLRAALAWWGAQCAAAPGAAAGLRLAGALWRFWYLRGHWREGREWLTRALAHRHRAPPAARARALYGAGFPGWCGGDFAPAGAWLQEYLGLCRGGVDGTDEAAALATLGFLAAFRGDDDRAEALGEEALTRARATDAARATGWALSLLRRQAQRRGDLERAAALSQDALARFREVGDAGAVANSLAAAGHLARRRGDPAGAAAHYAESLALFRDLGGRHGIATRLVDLGHAALERGDRPQAVERFAEGASQYRDFGDGQGVAAALTGLARAAAAAGRPRAAVQLLAAARTVLGAGAARLDRITEELYDGTLAVARAALPETAFAAAWGEGLVWVPEQAVDAARQTLAGAAPDLPGGRPARAAATSGATSPLTPCEREVAAPVGQGLANREIAARPTSTARTAENYTCMPCTPCTSWGRRAQIATWVVVRGRPDTRPAKSGGQARGQPIQHFTPWPLYSVVVATGWGPAGGAGGGVLPRWPMTTCGRCGGFGRGSSCAAPGGGMRCWRCSRPSSRRGPSRRCRT